jgi:hypothetical protein
MYNGNRTISKTGDHDEVRSLEKGENDSGCR